MRGHDVANARSGSAEGDDQRVNLQRTAQRWLPVLAQEARCVVSQRSADPRAEWQRTALTGHGARSWTFDPRSEAGFGEGARSPSSCPQQHPQEQ
jgi:hypothetical protein